MFPSLLPAFSLPPVLLFLSYYFAQNLQSLINLWMLFKNSLEPVWAHFSLNPLLRKVFLFFFFSFFVKILFVFGKASMNSNHSPGDYHLVLKGTQYQPPNTQYKEVIKKMEPGSSWFCMVGGQEIMDMNWNKTDSNRIERKAFSWPGHSSNRTSCSESRCDLHPWRFLRSDYIKPWVTWSDLTEDKALRRSLD